jgi:hypothetical protein
MFFVIEPKVLGELGNRTQIDRSNGIPIITELDYSFDDYQGEDLFAVAWAVCVTEKLKVGLQAYKGTGYEFREMFISESNVLRQIHPNGIELPKCHWLWIKGSAGEDSIGVATEFRIVVNEDMWNYLQNYNLNGCIVKTRPYKPKSGTKPS